MDGAADGDATGDPLGLADGAATGLVEGFADGATVRDAEGLADGAARGEPLGLADGAATGLAEGFADGDSDGEDTGLSVISEAVGAQEGFSIGSTVIQPSHVHPQEAKEISNSFMYEPWSSPSPTLSMAES